MDRREALQLSTQEVADRAGMDHVTYWRIESGRTATPQVDKAIAIAKALDISCMDMFASLGWLPSDELPSITPYLQSKFGKLPPKAHYRIEGYVLAQCEQYGVSFELDTFDHTP
ncbi:helix-turn-helix transcriptional regulator [Nocardia brasiliensis]